MFILMFTRLTNVTEESIFLVDTYDTKEQAQEVMRNEWDKRVYGMGWDADYSYIDDLDALCGTEDMYDTIRYHIFDLDNPCGFQHGSPYEQLGVDE